MQFLHVKTSLHFLHFLHGPMFYQVKYFQIYIYPIYTKKIDNLNVHFVPVTRYHYLVSNLRLTNTYSPCEQDFTNCNQFCTMWKNNNMWTYFHNEFFPIYQSNSNSSSDSRMCLVVLVFLTLFSLSKVMLWLEEEEVKIFIVGSRMKMNGKKHSQY